MQSTHGKACTEMVGRHRTRYCHVLFVAVALWAAAGQGVDGLNFLEEANAGEAGDVEAGAGDEGSAGRTPQKLLLENEDAYSQSLANCLHLLTQRFPPRLPTGMVSPQVTPGQTFSSCQRQCACGGALATLPTTTAKLLNGTQGVSAFVV